VPVPEGLDLDKWIVPPPKLVVPTPAAEDGRGRRPKKKKGKQKEVNGKVKEKPVNKLLQEDALVPVAVTEEEKAERERVGFIYSVHPDLSHRWSISRNGVNVSRGSRMIRITSLTRRKSRSRHHPLPWTLTRFLLSVSMILCLLRQVSPIPPAHSSPHYSFNFITAPARPETILREISQSSSHQNREFIIDREGEMPAFAKASTLPTPRPAFQNPNEFRQSMSSTPVSVASFPSYDVGVDEIPRSRSLDPIKVTRSKKGATGKKKRTTKPGVAS